MGRPSVPAMPTMDPEDRLWTFPRGFPNANPTSSNSFEIRDWVSVAWKPVWLPHWDQKANPRKGAPCAHRRGPFGNVALALPVERTFREGSNCVEWPVERSIRAGSNCAEWPVERSIRVGSKSAAWLWNVAAAVAAGLVAVVWGREDG
jgi:hypothetical protein